MTKPWTAFAAALLAGGLTFAAGVGSAAAQEPAPRTVAVHHGDLDLTTASGRASLDRRLGQAVRLACGTASSADLGGQNDVLDCRRDLNAGVRRQRNAAFAAARRAGVPSVLAARR